jgi:hypothetical protein
MVTKQSPNQTDVLAVPQNGSRAMAFGREPKPPNQRRLEGEHETARDMRGPVFGLQLVVASG